MTEFRKVIGDTGQRNKEVVRTTDEKTSRGWVRRVVWGVAIVVVGLLVSGTIAAIFWCN